MSGIENRRDASLPPLPIGSPGSPARIRIHPSGEFGRERPPTRVDPSSAPPSMLGVFGVGVEVGVPVAVDVDVALAVGVELAVEVMVAVAVAVRNR